MAGIYVHIPYCKKACHYCNFHFSVSLKNKNDFTAALLKEMELQKNYLQQEPVTTVYFGGGTPSLLEEKTFKQSLNGYTAVSISLPTQKLLWKQILMTSALKNLLFGEMQASTV